MENKRIDLREFLSYDHPGDGEVQGVIAREEQAAQAWDPSIWCVHTGGIWTDIAYDDEKFAESRAKEYLSQKLKGKILVDLGCGPDPRPSVAGKFGADTYIGVDKFNVGERDDNRAPKPDPFTNVSKKSPEKARKYSEGADSILVRADMLDFVSRLPSNSVNFMMDYVNGDIINRDEYVEAVVEELARATEEGGVVLMYSSEPFAREIGENHKVLRPVDLGLYPLFGSREVFEKVSQID